MPEANLIEVDGNSIFNIGYTEIVPIEAMHKDMPILGYRMGRFAYVTDANYITPQELDKIKGVDVLVINALRIEKHFSHFSLSEALDIIKILKPRIAYLTHLSHEMGFYDEVSSRLPENVFLAYDGLTVEI